MPILSVNNLSKSIKLEKDSLKVLTDVSFDLEENSFTTIIGPSGSGKSTLLRIIAGLINSSSGEFHFNDSAPKISFVFQSFALFPYLTIKENIEFGLKMTGLEKKARDQKVKELIEEVGLSGFENKHPKELSGGMRQRVGIARALAIEPDLLLLDEPFYALDEFTAEKLRKLLLDLWSKRKFTI